MLRFEFDPVQARELTGVDWDDFFSVFDRKGLELVYDDKPGSRFHKIVYPETSTTKDRRQPARKPARAGQRMNLSGGAGKLGRGAKGKRGAGRASAARGTARGNAARGGGAAPATSHAARTGGSRARRATSTRPKTKTRLRARIASAGRKPLRARSGRVGNRRRPRAA